MKCATGQDGKADDGITDKSGNPPCPWCGSERTVRAGKRELKASVRQMFRCNECWRRFSRLHRGDKHTHPRVVLRALESYCEGHSLDETAFIVALYARGLAYRAQVPLGEMRCAWFDEADCFSFRPEWG